METRGSGTASHGHVALRRLRLPPTSVVSPGARITRCRADRTSPDQGAEVGSQKHRFHAVQVSVRGVVRPATPPEITPVRHRVLTIACRPLRHRR